MNSPSLLALRWNWLARILLGGTFLIAGALKIADPSAFAIAVANFRLVPTSSVNGAAIILPWIEVIAALSVLAGCWLRSGALVLAVLSGAFFAAVTSALARGLNIECGCFGTMGGASIGLRTLALDAMLLSLALLLMRPVPTSQGKVSSND